jgi:putative flippase GtrA
LRQFARWGVTFDGRVCDAQSSVCLSRRVVSWFGLGLGASLVELGLLRALYEGLDWPFPLATAAAAEALILTKFFIADRWVFGHHRPAAGRLGRYQGVSAGALVVSWLVINALSGLLGVPYVVSFVLSTAASFAWSLASNFLWVWARPRG